MFSSWPVSSFCSPLCSCHDMSNPHANPARGNANTFHHLDYTGYFNYSGTLTIHFPSRIQAGLIETNVERFKETFKLSRIANDRMILITRFNNNVSCQDVCSKHDVKMVHISHGDRSFPRKCRNPCSSQRSNLLCGS